MDDNSVEKDKIIENMKNEMNELKKKHDEEIQNMNDTANNMEN